MFSLLVNTDIELYLEVMISSFVLLLNSNEEGLGKIFSNVISNLSTLDNNVLSYSFEVSNFLIKISLS